jgi:hypothetical protein
MREVLVISNKDSRISIEENPLDLIIFHSRDLLAAID